MTKIFGGNEIVKPITEDGRTGFDQYGQLMSWSLPDASGAVTGTMIRDVRGIPCRICNRGWLPTTEGMRDQVRINEWVVHGACHMGWRSLNNYYDAQEMLIKAGYLFNMEEVESQYPGSPPWISVRILQNDNERTPVPDRRIIFGQRKRVWEIQAIGFGNLGSLFEEVQDTKGYTARDGGRRMHYYIHAWTKEQVVDYLARIRKTISLPTDRDNWVHVALPAIDLTN